MKKYFLSLVAMAAAMLFATSCQESLVEPQVDGTTTFTVQVPGQMGTKATPYNGNVNKLYVQVYPEDLSGDNPIYQPEVVELVDGFFTVSISLIQDQKYDIIFWAQNGDAQYNVEDLRKVGMAIHHNSEKGAAFFAYLNDFVPTGTSQPVTLKRPFAQLNLGTTEASLKPNSGEVFLSQSKVKVSNVAAVFNTVTGMGEEPVVYETDLLGVPQSTITVNNVPYKYISMDYLPIVGDDQALVTVAAEIELVNRQVISHEFTNVPVRENYRTNIVGNLISSTTDFKVEIDDRFEEDYSNTDDIISNDYFVVDNVTAANDVLDAGETYVAINYIKNGETITLPDAAEYYLQIPAVDAKLNIVGDDATKVYITLVEDNSAVNGIELNIDTPSATVTVSKVGYPKVKNITSRTAQNTLILEGIVVGDIVVNGGNVILDNSTVGSVTKGKDNQETTEVILSNDSQITSGQGVEVVNLNTIDDVDKLQDAVEKLSKVILDQDLTINTKIIVTKDVVIDGNSKTITYVGSDRAFDVTSGANGANVTFKNLTIQLGSGYAVRGINYNTNGYLTIENVEILDNPEVNAFTYAINLPGSSDDANVEIRNSIIKGNIALNVWGERVTVNAEETEFYSLDYAEAEGYAAVKLNNDGNTSAENSVINIKGGKIIALDEKGEPSFATSNPTGTGKINIDPSTEVEGRVYIPVATVMYEGQNQFYSCETLQAAIDKAITTNAKSVRLIADIELTEQVTIAKDAKILLDLNGKTITGVDEAETSFGLITNTGNLNISGEGTIYLSAKKNRYWNFYSSVISNQPGGNLVVEGGVVIEHLGGTDMAYGIDNLTNGRNTSAIVTINDATVKSPYRAVRQFLNGVEANNSLTVNSGAVIEGANKSVWMQDPSTNPNTGTLVVNEGATLKGNVYLFVCAGSTEWPVSVSIAASTVKGEVLTGNVPDGYEVVEVDGVWTVRREVSDESELSSALAGGGLVVLGADIVLTETLEIREDQTVVLDLNGKTLTAEECQDGYAITNKGKLTIKNNGVINGVVYAEGTAAKTIIDGGTYNALENAKFVLLNSQGASLTINAATINGGSSYPIYSYDDNSKLVINDATVNATFGCVNSYGTNGSVEINGGTFKMTGVQGNTSHIAYFSRNCTVNINGGTFEKIGNISMSGTGGGGICVNGGADLTINGGSFAGDYDDVYNYGGSIIVKGGTYKFEPDFLGDGYKAVQDGEFWKVVPSNQ